MVHPRQLAFISKEFKSELRDELEFLGVKILQEADAFFELETDTHEPAWAQCVWRDIKVIEFTSITDAQAKLKAISPTWRYYGGKFHRRGELIAIGVDRVLETEKYHFTRGIAKKQPPVFTLADQNLIYYSHHVSRPALDGSMTFKEDKNPPSRAYLKLWEALTIINDWPLKNQNVVDLGSSPGSWTWALAKLGANVLSIDRAPLDAALGKFENIKYQSGDAFAFRPSKMDWVFSDVICYPDKLLEYVKGWVASGHSNKFVCSIKFAGKPDYKIISEFKKLPNSRVLHLTHNKNEVTWISHPKIKKS